MAETAANQPLFDQSAFQKLEQLNLVAERVRAGIMKGDRRSRKRGTSLEFADYRDYARGDDLRRLDWNVFARLERPFIKLLEEEEDLAVHLLVDGSRSMDWPPGDEALNKFNYARRLAAALTVIGLATGDQVSLTILKAGNDSLHGPYRGRGTAVRVMQQLESEQVEGLTDLNLALRSYGLRALRPGLLVLISDLLSPNGFKAGLDRLQARGYEIALIQLLSPDEIQPAHRGDIRLIDVETGEDAEITFDNVTSDRYLKRLQAWQQDTAAYCAKRAIHYIPVSTEMPWHLLVMQSMRAQGIVR